MLLRKRPVKYNPGTKQVENNFIHTLMNKYTPDIAVSAAIDGLGGARQRLVCVKPLFGVDGVT